MTIPLPPTPSITQSPILSYLKSLPPITLTSLYSNPSTCVCILRILTPLQQSLLQKMIYIEGVTSTQLASLVTIDSLPLVTKALEDLISLHLVTASEGNRLFKSTNDTTLVYKVYGGYKECLLEVISKGYVSWHRLESALN